MIDLTIDDFPQEGKICCTGSQCVLNTTSVIREGDFPSTKTNLTYYIRSLPYTYLDVQFQKACDEWSKFTRIHFKRIEEEAGADFIITSC